MSDHIHSGDDGLYVSMYTGPVKDYLTVESDCASPLGRARLLLTDRAIETTQAVHLNAQRAATLVRVLAGWLGENRPDLLECFSWCYDGAGSSRVPIGHVSLNAGQQLFVSQHINHVARGSDRGMCFYLASHPLAVVGVRCDNCGASLRKQDMGVLYGEHSVSETAAPFSGHAFVGSVNGACEVCSMPDGSSLHESYWSRHRPGVALAALYLEALGIIRNLCDIVEECKLAESTTTFFAERITAEVSRGRALASPDEKGKAK